MHYAGSCHKHKPSHRPLQPVRLLHSLGPPRRQAPSQSRPTVSCRAVPVNLRPHIRCHYQLFLLQPRFTPEMHQHSYSTLHTPLALTGYDLVAVACRRDPCRHSHLAPPPSQSASPPTLLQRLQSAIKLLIIHCPCMAGLVDRSPPRAQTAGPCTACFTHHRAAARCPRAARP